MNQNWLTESRRRYLMGWGISFLVSVCLLFIFLIGTAPTERPHIKKAQSLKNPNAFRQILDPFTPVLNLITPSELGVTQWQIGDYAEYQYHQYESEFPSFQLSTADADKSVGFHIIGGLEAFPSYHYWMKTTGMLFFRHLPGDIYQLVRPNDMRITSENRRYQLLENYIPTKEVYQDPNSFPIPKLVELGPTKIQTQAGYFECIHYRVELGPDFPTHEIWTNSKIRPWGIVRMQSENEVLELVSYGQNMDVTVPKLIQPLIEGISKLGAGCTSCHEAENCHESIFPPK